MPKLGKLINDKDNVMTALADIKVGEEAKLRTKGKEITYQCNQNVPFGHKIAIEDIKKGDKIIKYGEPIGSATQDIKKGDWVHTHNLRDDYIVLDKDGKPLTWP
jgi:altronate dehydratase small subunit